MPNKVLYKFHNNCPLKVYVPECSVKSINFQEEICSLQSKVASN